MKTGMLFALAMVLLLALMGASAPPALAGPPPEPGPSVPVDVPNNEDITTSVVNQAPTFNGHLYCEKSFLSIGFDDVDDSLLSLDIEMTVYLQGQGEVILDDFFLVTSRAFGTTFNFFGLSQQELPYEDIYGLAFQAIDPHGDESELVFVHYDPTKLFLVCDLAAPVGRG